MLHGVPPPVYSPFEANRIFFVVTGIYEMQWKLESQGVLLQGWGYIDGPAFGRWLTAQVQGVIVLWQALPLGL